MTKAERDELRRMIDTAVRERAKPPECKWGDEGRRGSHLGYASGCRCHDCRNAHAAYKRELRAQRRSVIA